MLPVWSTEGLVYHNAFLFAKCTRYPALFKSHKMEEDLFTHVSSTTSHLNLYVSSSKRCMYSAGSRNKLPHLGYCGIAAGGGCCTAAHISHIRAESSPNSAEEKTQHTGEDHVRLTCKEAKWVPFSMQYVQFQDNSQQWYQNTLTECVVVLLWNVLILHILCISS